MTIRGRLRAAERAAASTARQEAAHRARMVQVIQQKLGLPLPDGADRLDGVRRLRQAIEREDFTDFVQWVRDQHARYKARPDDAIR